LANQKTPMAINGSEHGNLLRPQQQLAQEHWRSLPAPRTCDQFRGLSLKRIRDPSEHRDCHRRLRSLNLADITRAQPNPIGKVLLRPTSFVA
jgi:hypothetical protein